MFETTKMWHPTLSPGWWFTYDPPQPVPLTEEINEPFLISHTHIKALQMQRFQTSASLEFRD